MTSSNAARRYTTPSGRWRGGVSSSATSSPSDASVSDRPASSVAWPALGLLSSSSSDSRSLAQRRTVPATAPVCRRVSVFAPSRHRRGLSVVLFRRRPSMKQNREGTSVSAALDDTEARGLGHGVRLLLVRLGVGVVGRRAVGVGLVAELVRALLVLSAAQNGANGARADLRDARGDAELAAAAARRAEHVARARGDVD